MFVIQTNVGDGKLFVSQSNVEDGKLCFLVSSMLRRQVVFVSLVNVGQTKY